MLNWSSRFSIVLFLDNNSYAPNPGSYDCLLAADAVSFVSPGELDALTALQEAHDSRPDWLFGHICYDYKNRLEPKLPSSNEHRHTFPLLQFFCPATVCSINREQTALTIETLQDPHEIYAAICAAPDGTAGELPELEFKARAGKESYLQTINDLRLHIRDGDCYEINYCVEGYCEDATVDPLAVFHKLNRLSPAPFAAWYKLDRQYMMCASPERYIRKDGDRVVSQPIKGTARRDADPIRDKANKDALRSSIKEQAENVMIVDLVRNDLARCCATGSVQVDELFGIYSFPQVHQMISTVSGRLNAPFTDAIRYSFPMGSMTGAPKFKVMQLIEQYEQSCRELFAGTVGYITPTGDFDFNVVIRSLFYNESTKYLSYQTGGAITYDSDPLQEWEEMRLKAWALERIFKRAD